VEVRDIGLVGVINNPILRLQKVNIRLESTQCSKSSVDYVEVLL
jgi:hypothetical protein